MLVMVTAMVMVTVTVTVTVKVTVMETVMVTVVVMVTWYVTRWSVGGRRPATETPDTDVEEPANFSLLMMQWKS